MENNALRERIFSMNRTVSLITDPCTGILRDARLWSAPLRFRKRKSECKLREAATSEMMESHDAAQELFRLLQEYHHQQQQQEHQQEQQEMEVVSTFHRLYRPQLAALKVTSR